MIVKNILGRISVVTIASAIFIGGVLAQKARAEWLRSLYAGQQSWAQVYLGTGEQTIVAETLLNLGDIDIELYDSSGQNLIARANRVGNEQMTVIVHQESYFALKYSMPFCINPLGACAVNIYTVQQ